MYITRPINEIFETKLISANTRWGYPSSAGILRCAVSVPAADRGPHVKNIASRLYIKAFIEPTGDAPTTVGLSAPGLRPDDGRPEPGTAPPSTRSATPLDLGPIGTRRGRSGPRGGPRNGTPRARAARRGSKPRLGQPGANARRTSLRDLSAIPFRTAVACHYPIHAAFRHS